MLGAALALTVFGASFIPTNVRAVFLNDGRPLAAKAFAARTRPAALSSNSFAPASGARSNNGQRAAAARPAGAAILGDAFVDGATPGLPIDTLFPPAASDTGENPLLPAGTPNTPLGRPMSAQGLVPFSAGLAGSPPSGSTTPTEPGTGPGTGPGLPTDPVSAVPEPGSWAMLLLGFFFIGAIMRRKGSRARGNAMVTVAINPYAVHLPTK